MTKLFKNKENRNKILITLGLLLLYRIGAAITLPTIDASKLIGIGQNDLVTMMNVLGAGSWQTFTFFSMGVGPYITASIVVELLAMDVIPALTELKKDGKKGQEKIDKIVRYVAIVLGFVQAYGITISYDKSYGVLNNSRISTILFTAVLLTIGSALVVFIGDLIEKKGIGNGISLLIFAGIVSSLPSQFYTTYLQLKDTVWKFVLMIVLYLAILIFVLYMTEAVRKINLQFTHNKKLTGGNISYLPLKINSASVMPVIFTSTVLTAPKTIMTLLFNFGWVSQGGFALKLYNFLDSASDLTTWWGMLLYVIMIFGFTFFYTHLQINVDEITKNLSKNNAYIPGIRPGKETKEHINYVLNSITLLGSLFLVFIAILPYVVAKFTNLPSTVSLGGTSIIIVVGIALEVAKTFRNMMLDTKYKTFAQRGWR